MAGRLYEKDALRLRPSRKQVEAIQRAAAGRPLRRASVEAAAKSGGGYTVDNYLEKVDELCASCQFELALPFCDKALELEPSSATVLESKAFALRELGRDAEAVAALRMAVAAEPGAGATKYLYLGQLLLGGEAVEALTAAVQILTAELAQCGDDREAERSRAVMIAEAFCGVAEIYLTDLCDEDGAQAACVDCLERALQYDPKSSQAMQTMASVSISSHQPDAAVAWMQQSLALWHRTSGSDGGVGAAPTEDEIGSTDLADNTPPYDFRINTAKILLELQRSDIAGEVLEDLLLEDDGVVEVWYLFGLAQTFAKSPEALSTLCRVKLLYMLMQCEQESIIQHTDTLLGQFAPADVQAELTAVAKLLGPAAEELL